MIQSLIVISAFVFGVKTSEVHDDKYSLSTRLPEYVVYLEEAQTKCGNSWLLEIYDENVATLLTKLNVNFQQNGILLGMRRDQNTWMWSDGTWFSGNVNDQVEEGRVVAYITNNNNYISYSGMTIFDSAGVICSKVTTKDNCAGWFHNGLCYFKPITTTCNWFQAHNVCIKNGATMAMFNNSETNFNKTFIDNKIYWVSLSRSTWMWTHADEAVTFNHWSSGQTLTQTCATTTSDGNEWKSVDCSGTYNIVCMKENNESTTQSPLPAPGINNITTTSKYSPIEEALSSGAKAGIGVGVSLLVVLILLIGVLVFKYFHQLKMKFGRKDSRKPLEPKENHYAEVLSGNINTSTDNIHGSINYVDLGLQPKSTSANDI